MSAYRLNANRFCMVHSSQFTTSKGLVTEDTPLETPPAYYRLDKISLDVTSLGRLGSGPTSSDRVRSTDQCSSFCLKSCGGNLRRIFSSGRNLQVRISPGGYILKLKGHCSECLQLGLGLELTL